LLLINFPPVGSFWPTEGQGAPNKRKNKFNILEYDFNFLLYRQGGCAFKCSRIGSKTSFCLIVAELVDKPYQGEIASLNFNRPFNGSALAKAIIDAGHISKEIWVLNAPPFAGASSFGGE
jgi:hypothetical protein